MLFNKCKSSGHKKLTADGKLRTAAICAEKGFNNSKQHKRFVENFNNAIGKLEMIV